MHSVFLDVLILLDIFTKREVSKMSNCIERNRATLSIVNDGSLMRSTDEKNRANLNLSADGTQVKEIVVDADLKIRGDKAGRVRLTISIATGKVDVEVSDAAGQFFGRNNIDLTVNGEKNPEISYEKQRSLKKIYTDENIARKGEAILADDLRYEIGGRLKELREANGVKQKEMCKKFPASVPSDVSAYCKWERGANSVPIYFLRELAEKWHVDLNWLILGTPMVMPTLPPNVADAIATLEQYKRNCQFGK